MGWASAGAIFDPVAQALIDLDADEHTKRKVLGPLIDALQDGDWDTEHESLEQFRHDPVIVSLFYQRNVGGQFGAAAVDGVLGFDDDSQEWTLTCADTRVARGCGELARRRGDSVASHDELVRLWAEHERDRHDGTGEVPEWALLDREAVAS